jgi:hypothetical protein
MQIVQNYQASIACLDVIIQRPRPPVHVKWSWLILLWNSGESRLSSDLCQFNASTSTPVMNLRRLFRFSVRAAEINKSVSSTGSSNGVSSRNLPTANSSNLLIAEQQKQRQSSLSANKLYPDLQNMWVTQSTRRTRSLPVRPTRIAVCPTSGDVLVVDSHQQLLQVQNFTIYLTGSISNKKSAS